MNRILWTSLLLNHEVLAEAMSIWLFALNDIVYTKTAAWCLLVPFVYFVDVYNWWMWITYKVTTFGLPHAFPPGYWFEVGLTFITGEAGWSPDQWGHSRFKTVNASADSVANQKSLTGFMRTLLKASS